MTDIEPNGAHTSEERVVLRRISAIMPFLAIAIVVVIVALIPMYGIAFPPLVDVAEHLMVAKLIWEKLSGISHLDLQISTFVGYRLFPALLVGLMAICKVLGIPFVFLPKIVAVGLMAIHGVMVTGIAYICIRIRSWGSYFYAACFALPAVVCMYSACWFIGFANYTLAITFLVAAVLFTERFLASGKPADAALLFVFLVLVYLSHPFAMTFWLMWCLVRAISSLATLTIRFEWKRFPLLGLVFLPVGGYHYWATSGTSLAPDTSASSTQSPFVTWDEWYRDRYTQIVEGVYLRQDDAADASLVALGILGLILISTVIAWSSAGHWRYKNMTFTSVLVFLGASWINEKFIPVPAGHWLAYDYRFISSMYAVSLVVALVVFVRFLPRASDRSQYKIFYVVLAAICVVISGLHLYQVRAAYLRFDAPASVYLEKAFNRERPPDNSLPRSKWYINSRWLSWFTCLERPDCVPIGSLFRILNTDVYPVKLLSPRRQMLPDEPSFDPIAGPGNAFVGGDGYGAGQFSKPRGIAVDGEGNFYVADLGNARIQKFTADGHFRVAFGRHGDAPGQFGAPGSIAVDRPGKIYVADWSRQKLIRFSPDGSFDKEWNVSDPGLSGPGDMAVGENGRIYIVDGSRVNLMTFDPVTESFALLGPTDSTEGRLTRATGIAVRGETVLVADLGSNRVIRFDLDGKFLSSWNVPAWERFHGNYPDVDYDQEAGRVYVTNGLTRLVLIFDLEGREVGTLVPTSPAGFDNLSSLVISKLANSTRLYVLNTGSEVDDRGEPSVLLFPLPTAAPQL